MFSRTAVPALYQIGHADDDRILNHADASRIFHQFFGLLFYHVFQIIPVFIQLDGLSDTAQ